jgi:hypothetical protein
MKLSYQIQTSKNIFSIFNPAFFNTDGAVVDKYSKDINDIIDPIDPNNPATIAVGMANLSPKIKRIKDRRDYLQEIIRNNQQALAVLRGANLNFNDPTNMRESFGGNLPTAIHQKQIDDGNIELTSANKIIDNFKANPKIQTLAQNPLGARALQALLIPTGGFGVGVSTFEGGPEP